MSTPEVITSLDGRTQEIAEALRAEWRMIASVTLHPGKGGEGFDAFVQLDRVVVKGSFEQQGFPDTPGALARAEARRRTALLECIRRVNQRFPSANRINSVSIAN